MGSFIDISNFSVSCSCFETIIDSCVRKLLLHTDQPLEIIRVVVKTFGRKYTGLFFTNSLGILEIDLTLFPKGLFIPSRGPFHITAYVENSLPKTKVNFLSETTTYPCIVLNVENNTNINFDSDGTTDLLLHEYICCPTTLCVDPCSDNDTK